MTNRLKEYIHKNAIKQRGFAKKIGVSCATLYALMNDKHLPNLMDADLIQKATRGYVTFEHWVKHYDTVQDKKKAKKQAGKEKVAKSSKLAIS